MLHLSEAANRRVAVATAAAAGVLVAQLFEHEFTAADFTAATDILEIGMMPADQNLRSVTIIGENLGAITASLGFMTGEFGNTLDQTRVAGAEIIAAANVNDNTASVPLAHLLSLDKLGENTGLGIKLSGDVAKAPGKKITVLIEYFA